MPKKKIKPMDHLITKPSEAQWLTFEDIGHYLFYLTEKVNEVIEELNKNAK